MAEFSGLRYLFFLLLALVVPASAHAEIFVNDTIALSREEVLIKAVIGGQAVIDAANAYKPESFNFTENSSKNLKTWQDIEKKLR